MKRAESEETAAVGQRTSAPGVVSAAERAGMSGLELLQGVARGEYPAAPMAALLGFRLVEVEAGRAVFQGTPRRDHYNPIGSVHGGYHATLLDSCMGCAVHSTLPAGMGYTTLEIKINYVRALTDATGPVRAEGRIIQPGRRVATAEGRLVDAQGKLYAHGTTTCLVFPMNPDGGQ
ncbi:MAG: PaaI family thioesterase [Pseudomonadota bacterium]